MAGINTNMETALYNYNFTSSFHESTLIEKFAFDEAASDAFNIDAWLVPDVIPRCYNIFYSYVEIHHSTVKVVVKT